MHFVAVLNFEPGSNGTPVASVTQKASWEGGVTG